MRLEELRQDETGSRGAAKRVDEMRENSRKEQQSDRFGNMGQRKWIIGRVETKLKCEANAGVGREEKCEKITSTGED